MVVNCTYSSNCVFFYRNTRTHIRLGFAKPKNEILKLFLWLRKFSII